MKNLLQKTHLRALMLVVLMLCGVGTTWGEEKTITLDYSSFGLSNSYALKTATVDEIGFTVNQGYKGQNNVIQMNSSKGSGILYNTTAISGLKSITVNVANGDKTYTITTGTSQKPTTNSQTGTKSGTFNALSGDEYFQLKVSGASYFASIEITYEDNGDLTPSNLTLTGAPVALAFDLYNNATAQTISYTTSSTGAITVSESEYVTTSVSGNTITVTPVKITPSAQTITISQAADDTYDEGSATFTVTISNNDPNRLGGANNPYTVAQALENTPASGNSEDVYVKGMVSKFQAADIMSDGTNYRYYISDDGTTSNQLLVYKGKGLNDVAFSNADDLQIGDVVVVRGPLSTYNNTKEINSGNYIVSLNRKDIPTLLFEDAYSVVKNGTLTINATSNSTGAITYQSSNTDIAEIDATTGVVTAKAAGTTTITATIAATETFKTANATVILTVTAPKHKVTFYQNGSKLSEAEVSEDESITFPTNPADIEGKTFVGWTTTVIDGTTNNAPATLVKTATMGTSDVIYYAVFANEKSGSPASLTKMTSSDTFTTGDKVVIVANDNIAMYQETTNSTYVNKYIFDNNVETVAENDKNWLTISTGSKTGTWKLGDDTNGYIFTGSSNNLEITMGHSTDFTLAWDSNKNKFTIVGNNRWLSYRSDLENKYFRMGGATTGNGSGVIYFDIYKYNTSSITYSAYCTTVEAEQPVVEPGSPVEIAEGYYSIKNGNGQYVNVAGRKTVTFVDESAIASAPGTVIRVKADDKGQVQILRSQGVDIPGYAEKAMNYVPKIVELIVDKLHAEGSGSILGEHGLDAIMAKFDESFDYHLYTEQAEGGVRIYGKTPSMQPVVDFYAENKTNVDAKLPMLETFINDAIQKILNKTNGSGASILVDFKLHDVWQKMGGTLTEPVDDATKLAFLQQVLANKENVWKFAYQTAMIYWTNLKNHPKFIEMKGNLGEYAQYIDKIEYIRPDVKYYLVQNGGKMDVFSQDNPAIISNEAGTLWTLENRSEFKVAIPEDNLLNGKYYTTLYTDFAYTLPEGVKAYKVTKVSKAGVAVKKELTTVPAQTPVLLEAESADAQTLTLSTEEGTAPTDNLLKGADYLINEYTIKTAQVESLFDLAKELLGDSYETYMKQYEHLMLRNSGTVNNKYFFGLDQTDLKNVENVRMLNLNDAGEKLGFYSNWTELEANRAFIVDNNDPVKLFLRGDVNRDGEVDINDATATVDIVLGKATLETHSDVYDFEAADANENGAITIDDVVTIVNMVLGKQ